MSGAMLPSNSSSSKGQRYALVVGANSAPHIPHLSLLKSAEEDAQSVASALQEEHCDYTLVCDPLLGVNATASAVRQALNILAVKRTDDDILLFYFAGHGFIHEDSSGQRQVYLATSDLDAHLIQDGEDIESISLDWLRERLYEKTKAGRVLLILDCCYAGNMGRIPGDLPLNTIFELFKHYLGSTNDVSLRKYRVTIAATGHDAEASEKSDHSMTNHLLAVLRGECHEVLNPDGEVTIGRLYDYLHQIMPAEQKPSFSGDTAGRSLVLATYPEYSAQALQAQQWVGQREERRERLQILSAAPDGERFLRDRLESFVGRETELHNIQQRIKTMQPSGGYVTITGQAGQGKSCIIAALIVRYASTSEERERIPFHFIPFNPGPEYQVTLLRNLMARLILKYDLSDLYLVSESRLALRDFFPKVLHDVATKGGQEMIFIDGLDQIESDSNGVRDLSFLPTNPPEGFVFVLGTRPDDTLKPLTLLKPTQSYLLPPLSREDFSILLRRRQVPFLEPRLADQFYEKMQQNALYLDLLARELHNQGSITPDAIETIIRRLADDPNNIFSLALERLARRGDWHEVIKPLLGALLVTYEPLTPWQLRMILNLDHQQIQNGLQCLSGLVTHIEQRYALYHLKFQDFLCQNEARPNKPCIFATDEEIGYHARLVQWCERDQLSTIWEDTRDSNEQSWRVYVRHHYISHLYATKLWNRLFAVLDEQSYGQAKERYDVGARSYIQDLKKGSLAATGGDFTDKQHINYLLYLWRYTLLRCSIQSIANGYPLELFKAMLVLGEEREVIGLIELITEPYNKVRILLLLAQHLFQSLERKREGIAIYMRAQEVARSIRDMPGQAQALTTLGVSLAQAQQWELAEEVARSIRDMSGQARALTTLAASLAQAQLEEKARYVFSQAEEVTRSIENASRQEEALTTLAASLAQAQQWKQAEKVTRSIKNASRQEEALTTLVDALAQAQQWKQAEKVTRSIKNASRQAEALMALAIALAQAQQWKQAEEVTRSIQDISMKAKALMAQVSTMTRSQQWKQAEKVARSIEDGSMQAEALTTLTADLAQAQQWKQAEQIAFSVRNISGEAKALTVLAAALAQTQQEERAKRIFLHAEEIACSIQDAYGQAEALTALAITLAQAQQEEHAKRVLLLVEKAIHSIQNISEQAKALTVLATILAQARQKESAKHIILQAEKVSRFIQDTSIQTEALTVLAIALAQAQQWEQAEEVTRSIKNAYRQAEALTALAIALAQAQQWEQAEKVTRSIENRPRQAEALMALAIALAQAQQWKQAERIAFSIENGPRQAEALTTLAITLAQAQQWKQAEKAARSIQDWNGSRKIEALTALFINFAQNHQKEQAERIVFSIENGPRQVEALTTLAITLAQAQQEESAKEVLLYAEKVAYSIGNASGQADALIALATTLAQVQQEERAKRVFSQVEEVARSIQDVSGQVKAFMALAAALTKTQQWEKTKYALLQAEKVARSIWEEDRHIRMLMTLAIALANAQQWEQARRIFSQVEEVARSIRSSSGQSVALWILVTALAQVQQWKQAERVAHSIRDISGQAKALTALVTALAQVQQWEQAEKIARSIRDISGQAKALTALATTLAEQGYHSRLLSLVQRSWQHAETRNEALQLLPLASGLITQTPALGMELYAAFQWVDDFLSGS